MTYPTRSRYPATAALCAALAVSTLSAHAFSKQKPPKTAPVADQAAGQPGASDHAASYYHYALAHMYEDLATTYGQSGYATQAIEEYKLALDNDPNSEFLKNGLAGLYYKTGRIRDAILAAQEQIKLDPNNLDAHVLLGRIYLRSLSDSQGNAGGSASTGDQSGEMLHLAIGEYTKIVELQPKSIENHLLLGQLYALDHDSAQAEAQFKAAQAIDPSSEDVVLNMARLFSEQGDPQRAATALNAVPVDDRTARINFALGATYDQLKQGKKAIDAYRAALAQEPDNLDAQRGLAQNLFMDGQLDAALEEYQAIAVADPQDAQSYLRIAEIERRKGQLDQALATLEKAKSLVQDSVEVAYNEALLNDSMGHTDAAIEGLKKLLADSAHADGQYSEADKSNRAIFIDRLAQIYREQNRTEDAVALYKQLLPLGGDYTVRGYQGEVDAYRDARMWPQATAAAQEAAQELPKNAQVKLTLAGQLADTGKPEEGIAMAKSLLKGTSGKPNPEDRDVEMALAQIYSRLRRWNDANAALDQAQATATKPEDKLYIAFLRGSIYDREKQYNQAEAEFRKALAIDPSNAMVLNYLGYSLADRGVRLDEALKLLRKAVELDPQNGSYLDSLGWAYYKLGQYPLAEENLRKAVERMPQEATIHEHLGELYEKTDQLKAAAEQYERALAEFSKTLPADIEPGDVEKARSSLESTKVKLAKATSSGRK